MPRARSPERDLAYQLWLDSGKTRKLKDIAQELSVSEALVRKWKSKDKWEEGPKIAVPPMTKREAMDAAAKTIAARNKLTDKQQLFCIYYSKSFNPSGAYQKAFGCSHNTAMVNSCRLLKKPAIEKEIRRLKQERYARAFLDPEDIFQRYLDIAFADISDLISWGREEVPVMSAFGPVTETDPLTGEKVPVTKMVNVVKLKDSADVDTALITEVKQGRDGVSVKLPDRLKALEWLADHLDLATPEQRARTEKIIAETEKLRAGQGSEDDDMVLQFIRGMKEDKVDG